MSVSVRGIKHTRSMSNQTCHFGSLSGLPPRVGVPVSDMRRWHDPDAKDKLAYKDFSHNKPKTPPRLSACNTF